MSVLSYSNEKQGLVRYYTKRGYTVTNPHKEWPEWLVDKILSEKGKETYFIEMQKLLGA